MGFQKSMSRLKVHTLMYIVPSDSPKSTKINIMNTGPQPTSTGQPDDIAKGHSLCSALRYRGASGIAPSPCLACSPQGPLIG